MLADGRLRDAKLKPGTGETQVARRRFEGPQCIERKVRKLGLTPHFLSLVLLMPARRTDRLSRQGPAGIFRLSTWKVSS
jgi:hypothetical protein